MNVLRITSISLLLISVCSTSTCSKNDQAELSAHGDPNFVRRSRRIGLNEYLVPPPIPHPQPVRSGRVAKPFPAETPGYFSQLMNWLNPFNFASSPPTHPKSLPQLEPPAPPKPHNPPPFNIPSGPHSGPHHPPLGPQPATTLYTPFVGRFPPQHPPPPFTAPTNAYSGPSLGPPPSPPLQFYNVPSPTFHDIQVPPEGGRGIYLPANKGKACNLCNKIPWVPMQSGGFNLEKYPLPPQLSNGYLPPSSQANHDAQHAASQEIRVPDFSQLPVGHKGQFPMFNTALPNLLLYPMPMPPLYEAEPFARPSQSPDIDGVGRFELSSLPVTSTVAHTSPEINNEQYNVQGDEILQSFGTEINRARGAEIKREHADKKESVGTSIPDSYPPISAPAFNREYQNNPSSVKQENVGVFHQPVQYIQNTPTSFGSSSLQSQNFVQQNDNEYQEQFKSNTGQKTDSSYLTADLNPSANFRTSPFYNQDIESLNYQISDDLSPSGTAQKDSHATTQPPPVSTFSLNEEHNTLIHFEESPLLDLSKKDETSTQEPTTTTEYPSSENTVKTTTDYNTEDDNLYFEDSTSTVRLTESYSQSDIQDINAAFRPPISTTTDFLNSDTSQYSETSTVSTGYTSQQEVSYVPSQSGYLWPSLLSNTTDLKDDALKNHASLNHLVQWNHSFSEIKNFGKQDSADLRDAKDAVQRQPGVKRNKQVQVIIPYTSDYTPIPFQQSRGDWSVKTGFERTQPRKIPPRGELNVNDYLQQESRNEIRVINQSQFDYNDSKRLYAQSIRPSLNAADNSKSVATKANNSIDVRRLQKNIDNWTIQEYSKPTTFSTVLPSSLHPYLSPSKRIPTEYLTTTEPGDHTSDSRESKESVKTYSLAGFSFNEIEHEGSASNRVEEAQVPIKVLPIESPKATPNGLQSENKSLTEEKASWEAQSVSISPTNKERVYVVTPQPVPEAPSKKNVRNQKEIVEKDNFQRPNDLTVNDASNSKNNLSKFEAIEKAYQVLPQAVNNLAVATTGKENVPLWGIMEHEEFASLNLDEHNEEAAENDEEAGPVLYSGHSKVSRAKR